MMLFFRNILKTIIFLLITHLAFGAKVDTVVIHSTVMDKAIKNIVITPDDYNTLERFPVVYLLHGYSDDYKSWVNYFPNIASLSDRYDVIIVCPDGGFSSWYLDSPMDSSYSYETYVSREVIQWVDKT